MNEELSGLEAILATFDLTVTDLYGIVLTGAAFYLYTVLASSTLFKPFLKLYEERELATTGAESSATTQIEEAAELEQKYNADLQAARVELMKSKLDKLHHASKQAANILSEAEDKAVGEIAAARTELSAQADKIRTDLDSEVDAMAEQIARRLKTPLEVRT